MAKKVGSRGSLGFDYYNLTQDQKQKVSTISEQFPEISKEHIAIMLQHYQFDSDKTVDGITTDGGAVALKFWNTAQSNSVKVNNKNKKRNKKKNKKEDGSIGSIALCNDADDSSSLHSSNVDFDGERESNAKTDDYDDTNGRVEQDTSYVCSSLVSNPTCDELSLSDTLVENEGSGSPLRTDLEDAAEALGEEAHADSSNHENEIGEKISVASGSPREKEEHSRSSSQKQFTRQRHGSSHHSKSSFCEDPSSNAQKRGGFNKCRKDLLRQTVSLQRIENQLESHLDDSCKNLKNAFVKIRKMLDDRQQKLEQEMEKVKIEARSLLKSRQDLSSDLKRRCDRSMSDSEWNDLRADIKQFVTERKYDDDLGKTIWFQWSIDNLIEEIEKFGEICPVKNAYSQRQSSQEPNTSPSIPADSEASLTVSNADLETVLGSDHIVNNVEEAKPEKDVHVKNVQNETRARVFSNKRYSQHNYGGRYPQNHNNRGGQAFYRARGHMGAGFPRGRNYEPYRQYGGERHNDYNRQQFPQYHNRTDFSHLSDEKPMDAVENSNSRYGMQHRDNQGHYRGHERRPYGAYRHRAFNQGWPRAQNRAQRCNTEAIPAGNEPAVDKNANYNEVSQESKDITNGF